MIQADDIGLRKSVSALSLIMALGGLESKIGYSSHCFPPRSNTEDTNAVSWLLGRCVKRDGKLGAEREHGV